MAEGEERAGACSQVRRERHTALRTSRPRYSLSSFDRRSSLSPQELSESLAESRGAFWNRSTTTPNDVDDLSTRRMMEKRRRIAMEWYDSERIYVEGLALLETLYYNPLYISSQTDDPILPRHALSHIFCNFVDIVQLSRELFFRLEERLGHSVYDTFTTSAPFAAWDPRKDTLGDLLVPIAPFFKMYTLFTKNYAGSVQYIEQGRKTYPRFDTFVQRADVRAGAQGGRNADLGFQSQLLTLVQRVPRYRLFLQALLHNTPRWHADHAFLHTVSLTVDKIAAAMDDQVHEHDAMLVALGLQRTLLGMDERLIVPGRRLLKWGSLLKTGRKDIQLRRIYLFSDMVLLASDRSTADVHDKRAETSLHAPVKHLTQKLRLADFTIVSGDGNTHGAPSKPVVADALSHTPTLRHRLDVHSPQCSFSLYAPTHASKEEWITAIREAQAECSAAVRSLHTPHQAESILASRPSSTSSSAFSTTSSETWPAEVLDCPLLPEQYSAPIWIPDSLALHCTRCCDAFTVWRRKHHCRLCGQVFCHACSNMLFRIDAAKPICMRACTACFTSTFGERVPMMLPARAQPSSAAVQRAVQHRPGVSMPNLLDITNQAPSPASTMPPPLTPVRRGARRSVKLKRPSHQRSWSIVSVPSAEAQLLGPVQTSTSGSLTLGSVPAAPAFRSDMPRSASAAAVQLQSVLHSELA
ncbi:hypothetical protein MVES1_002438 [Malassezia vespertilionis]|uniref:uncharacterized protein n=1 Tax=Malassezia vespertilionis TaxID=2020962 RepID=UPI0024B227AC|nr:uncharacterized protein MVES1_002438 [Malassezia vespertilionis]WFD07082.1 hypothetical protein MVES1_002438 [Malassezia vespertilionis]